MNDKNLLLERLVEEIELPVFAYEKAKSRYEDLGEWLGREESVVNENNPHIFAQGSFCLGTAIHPLNADEVYDLDLACKLRTGVTAQTHTQEELKKLVGYELGLYRSARGIKASLEEKHRCWRLEYADGISFHMDIVPCIPQSDSTRKKLKATMDSHGFNVNLSSSVSELAVGITDNRLIPNYQLKNVDWLISNPEGYAKWFEAQMQPSSGYTIALDKSQVDEFPMYKRKTPLQKVIQLLKRHRDQMFLKNLDRKPISSIITTIVAQSYKAGSSFEEALVGALKSLNSFADAGANGLQNPVNPEEKFTDRWFMPQYASLKLKENFLEWVMQAVSDFNFILQSDNPADLSEAILKKLAISIPEQSLKQIGVNNTHNSNALPTILSSSQARPWLQEE